MSEAEMLRKTPDEIVREHVEALRRDLRLLVARRRTGATVRESRQ